MNITRSILACFGFVIAAALFWLSLGPAWLAWKVERGAIRLGR